MMVRWCRLCSSRTAQSTPAQYNRLVQTGKVHDDHSQDHDDHHGHTESDNTQQRGPASSLLAQGIHAHIFGRTPTGGATIGAEGKEFIGRTECAIAIIVCSHFVADLFTFKYRMAVRAAQEQVLGPVAGFTGRTAISHRTTIYFARNPAVM